MPFFLDQGKHKFLLLLHMKGTKNIVSHRDYLVKDQPVSILPIPKSLYLKRCKSEMPKIAVGYFWLKITTKRGNG